VATWLLEAGPPPRDLLCEQGFNGKAFTGGHGLPGLYKTAALPPERDLITPGAEGGSSLGGDWVGAGDGDLLVPVTPDSSVRDERSGRGSVGGPRRHAPSQFPSHPRPESFTGGRRYRGYAGQGWSRTPVNTGQQYWKACWCRRIMRGTACAAGKDVRCDQAACPRYAPGQGMRELVSAGQGAKEQPSPEPRAEVRILPGALNRAWSRTYADTALLTDLHLYT
jgi:hypothetical protein